MTDQYWTHKALCQQAEITARSAACEQMRETIDILEEGLQRTKRQLINLKQALETIEQGPRLDKKSDTMEAKIARVALEEFRHDAEADQAEPGMETR